PTVSADAQLAEEDRPAAVELDGDREGDHQRRDREQAYRSPDEVEGLLDDSRGACELKAPHPHQRDAVQVVELDRGADALEPARPGPATETAPDGGRVCRR